MTVKIYIRSILLAALVALSLAGFMIHSRIHLIVQNPSFTPPIVASLLGIAVIPAPFWFKKTLPCLAMNRFKWFTRNWWILHIAATAFFFWLGHAIRF